MDFEFDDSDPEKQLNMKAVEIADEYDISDEQKVKLEMDMVALAWEYYKRKEIKSRDKTKGELLTELTKEAQKLDIGY